MKSLKRTLSLVLVLVMVLGLFGVAGAAFTDDKEIQYKEAVDVMTGIGAIAGMGDGNFAPKGNLTRAQAAKMVTYTILGEENVKFLTDVPSTFKDVTVAGGFAWAIPSIEYLKSQGIVVGRGDGIYDPNGNVTGYELAKMLLVALGYGKNDEFAGTNFELGVALLANKTNIFLGSKAASKSAPATREEAALYCFNTIAKCKTVTFSKDTEEYTETATTIGEKVYGLAAAATPEGVITSKSADGKTTTIGGTAYKYNADFGLFGHTVKIYCDDSSKEVYALVDTSTVVTVDKAIDSEAAWKAAFASTDITNVLDNKTNVFENYAHAEKAIDGLTLGSAAPAGTYILDGKDIVSYIAPMTYTIDKIKDISTTAGTESITLTKDSKVLANNATSDVVNEYEGIAKDDIVTVTVVGAKTTLTKVKTIEGTISKINNTTYTLGGVDYKESTVTNDSGLSSDTADFTKTFVLYLDLAGNYIACVEKPGETPDTPESDLAYLVAKYSTTVPASTDEFGETIPAKTSYWAQCLNMKGEQVVYQITKAIHDDATPAVSAIYKVTVAEATDDMDTPNDAKDDVKANYATFATSGSTTATSAVAAGTIKFGTNDYFTSDIKFIYVDGTLSTLKTTVKEGVHVIAGSINKEYVAEAVTGSTSNKTVSVVFVEDTEYVAPTDPNAPVAGTAVMFGAETSASTSKVPTITAGGTKGVGYEHTVYIDGVKTTIITATADAITGFKTYTVDGNLYAVANATAANLKDAAKISNMFNGLLTNSEVTDISVADATVVNLSGKTAVPTDPTALTNDDTVALVLNEKGTAVVMIFVTASDRA